MGKGDKKTRRGKLFMGSYGNTRPKKSGAKYVKPEVAEKVVKAEKVAKPKAKAKKEA